MSHQIGNWLRRKVKRHAASPPTIIPRSAHRISRANISENALKVLYRLKNEGYDALLVGGGVRDLLLGHQPKDFDVVTDAHPDTVRKCFRNSRVIGRRFRLVHVFFPDEIVEVSTFRANVMEEIPHAPISKAKKIIAENTYGTIEEDAWRRDFTVNALYYNIEDFGVIDYTQGMADLQNRLIRMIGDPVQRYHEDPVRLLRALRFAAKLNFELEENTESALLKLPHLLQHVPPSRLFDEILKLFFKGHAWVTYQKLTHYRYFHALFPTVTQALSEHKNPTQEKLIELAMRATDERFFTGQSINPGFLLAVLLWPVLSNALTQVKDKKNKFYFRLHTLIHEVMVTQARVVNISKRFQWMIRDIWMLQFYLEARRPRRIISVFRHRYFRAAIDFMALRVAAGEITAEKWNWWHTFQYTDSETQHKMIESL